MVTNATKKDPRNMKAVWNIVENENGDRPIWIRCGTGFVNRDGSLNVFLDVLPINGRLHIRDLEQAAKPADTETA